MPEAEGGPASGLAIVAGRGPLPREIAECRAKAGLPYLLIVFPGLHEPWMDEHPMEHHRFERLGRVFRRLRVLGVTHVVFAGAMNRPRIQLWRMDFSTIWLAVEALSLLRRGDDALLRGCAALVERRGLRMIGPAEVLGGRMTVPRGGLTARKPTAQDLRDAARAAAIVDALGPLDVGQGAIVANGLCLAVEAIEGTDLMLRRTSALPDERRGVRPSGVLYKGPKPGQDERLDMPAIGPETVARAAEAGLNAIVVRAGQTVLLDAAATRAEAERTGLAVYGATSDELRSLP